MNDGRSIQQRAEAQALAAELTKYGVTIMPTHRKCEPAAVNGVDERDVDLLRTGSGICIHVGGRYFIATAAHVINSVPYDEHFVSTPTTRNWPLLIVDGGHRGGLNGDPLDVGWLELGPAAAAAAERTFLDISRIRTHCEGDEDLVMCGASLQDRQRTPGINGGPQTINNMASCIPTRGIRKADKLVEPLHPDRMFLDWPKRLKDLDDEWRDLPEPNGMSGGGVWALNKRHRPWRPDVVQLVGIEYAVERRAAAGRYLRAFQMQVWLQMLREDVPELAKYIDPMLAAGGVVIR